MPKPTIARTLRFETLDDVLAEARKIAAQPDAPSRGNWTPAQNLWHVGRFLQAGIEGFPAKVPFLFKLLGPLFKNRALTKGFNPGIKLPQQAAVHMVAPASTTMDEGIGMIETWIAKAKADGFLPTNPMLGKMTTDQWVALHCRHAEMHFGLIELSE